MTMTTNPQLPKRPTDTGEAPRGERRISEFRAEDAGAVAEMFNGSHEGWPDGFGDGTPWTAAQVLELQRDHQPLATFIAWDGAEAAGYCSFYEYPGEPGQAGYVGLLNAATRFHGRGHGRDLLQAALQRCLDLGYRRVDLHTWEGNMKAVPLYKKSGYFWVPDTAVHMENYLPLLLRIPALADFWADADWYQSQVRDLTVQEDLRLDGKMRVYPYEFRHGNRFVRATIDATARGLTALETERWRLSCRVDDRRLIIGRPGTVRWEVENRSGRPLALTILASAGDGLALHKEETVTVTDRYVAEAPLTAALDYRPPTPGQPASRVESLLLVDGLPVRLETGVEVKPAVEVRLLPRRLSLVTGQSRTVTLQVQNHLTEAASLALHPSPSVGLTLEGEPEMGPPAVTVEAESYGGRDLRLRAVASGLHTLELRPTVTAGGEEIAVAPVSLPLPALAPGEILAYETDAPSPLRAERAERHRELRVETATHRLLVELRAGGCSLEEAATGDHLAGARLSAGPPFSWSTQALVQHEATVEQQAGAVTVHLRGAVPHLPAAAVEHELHLTAGGLLRLTTALTNTGATPLDVQAATESWAGDNLPTIVLPTVHGLVATSLPEFPDWSGPDLKRPATFREGWAAREGDGRVAGLLWSEASRIEVGSWNLADVRQGKGALAPGERRLLPPVYLYAGPGDWHVVRALWRNLIAPDADERPPATREAVALDAPPSRHIVLTDGTNELTLDSLTDRALDGTLHWEVPVGWSVEPAEASVGGLRIGHPATVQVKARRHAPGPGAAAVRAALRSERLEQRVFDGALLDLGRHPGGVRIAAGEREGHSIWTVDNGYMRFVVAPQFVGSIVAIETLSDGINHLRSAFPQAREFGWMRPWYGGLYAAVYGPGWGHFPDAGRLAAERLTVEPARTASQDGQVWQGVAVGSTLQTAGLRGLALHALYLTLPGSNLLALRLTVTNHTGATLPVDAALVGYFQPGGSLEDVELLLDPAGERRLRRAQRTIGVDTGDWVGVRNPRDGRTIALVAGAADIDTHVDALDWGALGGHAGLQGTFRLAPGSARSALAYLVLAADATEAAAYRALARAELP